MDKIIHRKDLPTVCINLLTKDRTDYAVTTVKKCLDNLKYEGKLAWYISDGGSGLEHVEAIEKIIPAENLLGFLSGKKERTSPGQVWNLGLEHIFDDYDIYLRLEDDMALKSPMDITTWVKVLMTQPRVGMIRLGQIVIDQDVYTVKFPTYTHVGYTEEVYLLIKKTQPYAFSGHPALIHKRFHDIYGYYPEGLDPGKTEIAMDDQVRSKDGPWILFPYDMGKYGTWGNWDHIGKEKS